MRSVEPAVDAVAYIYPPSFGQYGPQRSSRSLPRQRGEAGQSLLSGASLPHAVQGNATKEEFAEYLRNHEGFKLNDAQVLEVMAEYGERKAS